MVACAVTADGDVGVDVECIDRDVEMADIAARFFAPAEAAHLGQLDAAAQRDRFFDLWTLKEALVKALGTGMATSLSALAFTVGADGDIRVDAPHLETSAWRFGLFAPGPRHRLAVAVRRDGAHPAQLIFRSPGREP
jgi:4'-phosphopantetheinyl transferase